MKIVILLLNFILFLLVFLLQYNNFTMSKDNIIYKMQRDVNIGITIVVSFLIFFVDISSYYYFLNLHTS